MMTARAALAVALGCSSLGAAEYHSDPSPAVELYNPNMAKAFAALATLSYCANEFPRGIPSGLVEATEKNCGTGNGSWCAPAGFAVEPGTVNFLNAPDLYSENQIFAIVARWNRLENANLLSVPKESGCLVVFRGSIGTPPTAPNWIRDDQTDLVDATTWPECKNCQMFSGYYAIWQSIEDKLLKKLEKSGCSAESKSAIYVSGHSLGGGMSYFAMYGLQRLGFDVQVSYNFAAPAPGNAFFINAFVDIFKRDVPVYHIGYAVDRTPTTPIDLIHPPFHVYYPGEGNYYEICDHPASGNCGLRRYTPSTLTSPEDANPMTSPHCMFPEAPYHNFCQFMGMPSYNMFFLGPRGMLDYNLVCVNGGLMSSRADAQPTALLV